MTPVGCAKLVRPLVPHVTEAGRLRETVDRSLITGQKMPGGRGAWLLVARDIPGFLRRGGRRRVARIEADGDDLEILAGLEREHIERARQAVDDQRAQHRAVVVREHHHDGSLAEVIAERHRLARLVPERRVERHRFVEVLIEPDLAQRRRNRGRHHPRLLLVAVGRRAGHLSIHDGQRRNRRTRREKNDDPKSPLRVPRVLR